MTNNYLYIICKKIFFISFMFEKNFQKLKSQIVKKLSLYNQQINIKLSRLKSQKVLKFRAYIINENHENHFKRGNTLTKDCYLIMINPFESFLNCA